MNLHRKKRCNKNITQPSYLYKYIGIYKTEFLLRIQFSIKRFYLNTKHDFSANQKLEFSIIRPTESSVTAQLGFSLCRLDSCPRRRVTSLPFGNAIDAIRHGPVFAELFSFLDGLRQLVVQRFGQPETGDPADHRQYAHNQQRQY